MKTFKQHLQEASLWDYMYKKNKAVFYRGQSSSGKGMGIGMLGLGIYLTICNQVMYQRLEIIMSIMLLHAVSES